MGLALCHLPALRMVSGWRHQADTEVAREAAQAMKIHWLRTPRVWTHGSAGRNVTSDKRRVTCALCKGRAGLGPNPYQGRPSAGPVPPNHRNVK